MCVFIQTKISLKIYLIRSSGSKYVAENKCSFYFKYYENKINYTVHLHKEVSFVLKFLD